ncbi:MAG TPA: hypothetical protein DCP51_04870 [Clostridiales bacterium]|nr:hypothetical protein [Clostridiales bacterium]
MFKISSIKHGWFDIILSNEDTDYYICSSSVGGYDTAKALLNAISDIYYKKKSSVKLCFNAENEAHIIHLDAENSNLSIIITEINDKPFKYLSEQTSSLDTVKQSPPIIQIKCDINNSIKEVIMQFTDIIIQKKVDEYNDNWFPFPQEEYDKIYNYLKYRF